MLCASINKAGSSDPNKIRAAILSTEGYKGADGEYNFNEFGDGLHGYNIVRNEKGVVVFDNISNLPAERRPSRVSEPQLQWRSAAADTERGLPQNRDLSARSLETDGAKVNVKGLGGLGGAFCRRSRISASSAS